MLVDLHVHTNNSKCAKPSMTIRNIVTVKSAKGLDGIGITDHLHLDTDAGILQDNRRQLSEMDGMIDNIWIGVEVDVLTPSGDITGDPRLFQSLDYVLAGVHHFHLPWVESPNLSKSPIDILYFAHRQLIGAIRNPWIDALAHPWVGLFKYLRSFNFSYNLLRSEWIEELGVEAKSTQTAIEIPPWALLTQNNTPDEEYLEIIVRPLIKTGCPLMIGTDAHRPEHIGSGVGKTISILLHEGATRQQLWTPSRTTPHLSPTS